MNRIEATTARYIKLGPAGAWESACLEDGTLRLGHKEIPHELALTRDREAIRQEFIRLGLTPSKASDKTREVLSFYDGDEEVIWVTFAKGQMWWVRAGAAVFPITPGDTDLGARLRRVQGAWSNTSANGTPLYIHTLSGHLTRTAAYRQTICQISDLNYLLAKLNDDRLPDVDAAMRAKEDLLRALIVLIRQLTWQDFELLVDLIFTTSGWRRTGVLGGVQKTVDIELELPSTGERAYIQVKSETDQLQLNLYLDSFAERKEQRMFYAYHSQTSELASSADKVTLLGPEKLAQMALRAGLTDWVIERVS